VQQPGRVPGGDRHQLVLARTGQDEAARRRAAAQVRVRLEQVAAPGAILVTRETLELVEGEVRARPLGRVEIKGVPEGLEAYEILGLRPKPEMSRRLGIAPALVPKLSM